MRNQAEWYLPARRREECDISSATAVFHEHYEHHEIREITVINFHAAISGARHEIY